ncbi:MAG: alanine:cation symporter family protein [Rhodospirillales bacterium]|nr:alanine:cation symporter family protein [Alphaproteobacteria bacterium]USO03377.1 MAG: alanine:cation symporter family protein [Rhodospirillales bacterium]
MSIDQQINESFRPVSEGLASVIFYAEPFTGYDIKLILVWLVIGALFFTLYLGFINFRYFGHAIRIVSGKYYSKKEGVDGQISPFQALMTSLSGTVGLGNIAGVAVAISVGGPGAAFWMFVMGLFGMSTKFAEAAMGVKYRHHATSGDTKKISGGPMYYLRDAFDNRDIPYLGHIMASLFSFCCAVAALGAASMFQSNQSFQQFVNITGGAEGFLADKGWMYGLFLAFLTGLVILGGIRSIAAVASKIVPLMGGLYLLSGLVVIGMDYERVPGAFIRIFELALTPEAGLGGVIGALLVGVQRAVFSNEAGLGSAAIPHSAAQTDSHIRQGFVAMLGPFIDTAVICMVTAFVIVLTGAYQEADGMEGMVLTSRAFETAIPFFPYLLAFIVFLFAFSTIISWSYYGLKSATYLFGESNAVEYGYKIIFLAFVVVGASSALENVILFTDSAVFIMAIPNLIGLYLLAPELKRDLKAYIQDLKNE